MIYAVTGSTGHFGGLVIEHLMAQGVAPESIVALARNPEKAAPLAEKGVAVRIADYGQPATLDAALDGVDRLLFVSSSELGKRVVQHTNVVNAAASAGVKLLAYISLTRADTTSSPLGAEHKATEAAIRLSGLPFVLLRNNWYTENYVDTVQRAREMGYIQAAVGDGRVASATRSDFAEAAARALTGDGHEGKAYELAGRPWDYRHLASVVSGLVGRQIEYRSVSSEQQRQTLLATGMPEEIAGFVVGLDVAIAEGALDIESDDLATLLGREPATLKEGLEAATADS